ncbi:hypothetical protein BE11_22910 [Sorangium cellulosum]|nr:hypothetical protein BE11_22910 [Sorangium cellulosum]
MTDLLATYSFLPWLRQGIANKITASDHDPAVKLRATIPVALQLTGDGLGAAVAEAISKDVQLFGPGDIVGVEGRAIIRVDPRPSIADLEPNYLPCIEFYDEDFPWRYTPAAPDGARLRPWIMLVVLEEGEFEEGARTGDRPLPNIKVASPAVFPPLEQLWAFAHVHLNRDLGASPAEIVSGDMGAVLPKLAAALHENPDHGYSRIICPRRLEPGAAYHAFLIPVFESGRLAGLGLDPGKAPSATHGAWAAYPSGTREAPDLYPFYHRWSFRTGSAGDFEYLVRLLRPKAVDPRVGARDMDVTRPGSNLPGITDPALGGVLKLGGALRVPRASLDPDALAEADRYDQWAAPYPHPFQEALAGFLNLQAEYAAQGAEAAHAAAGVDPEDGDPDPLITPPIYGRWHALMDRLLTEADGAPSTPDDNWVHELNLDPRFRVAAGLGTRVVQQNQEEYMRLAWEQIGDVLEAIRRIRAAQLAAQVSLVWHGHLRSLQAASVAKSFALTAPLHARVVAGSVTVRHEVSRSALPRAAVSAAMRRITRPRGRLVRALPFDERVRPDALLERLNKGDVHAAPPKAAPAGVNTVDSAAASYRPAAGLISERAQHPDKVGSLPRNPEFKVREPKEGAEGPREGDVDSKEAERFKRGLIDAYALVDASARVSVEAPRPPLDLHALADAVLEKLHPSLTIPRRTFAGIDVPPHIAGLLVEQFTEPMYYPQIDVPMYGPLKDISTELFLPNVHLIEENSVTLLETNQRFIEAYMVGLNHEFGRELLWREYPSDNRGSYFRQFWDVSAYLDLEGGDEEAARERLRDIPPIHRWSKASRLGDHDHREVGGASEEEAVLAIRGQLLKRYPNTVIYAHRAEWQRDAHGNIDRTKERRMVALTAAEGASPPRSLVRTPLYAAKIDPDIYFFGFDLVLDEARGGTGEDPGDDPGWFFVLKERPGEPRFGLREAPAGSLQVWSDLAWSDVSPGGAAGGHIPVGSAAHPRALTEPTAPEDQEKVVQWQDDRAVAWNAGASAADLAYVLFQAPVLVAIHAAEMLRRG